MSPAALVLDGKTLADELRADVAVRVAKLATRGVVPGLAVVACGDDPASVIYVRNKAKAAEKVGIAARTVHLAADADANAVAQVVDDLNNDPSVHGILVQLPLPAGIDETSTRALTARVKAEKDVDGLHPANLGRLLAGDPTFLACTPAGCMRLIAASGVSLAGKRAVVVGRSAIVGKPMALLLLGANATVTICHSRTEDLPARIAEADVVVAAIGKAKFIRGEWIKPGAVVIDVGINRDAQGRVVGDVDYDEAVLRAGAITPVPGGVGPMTVACLLDNVCRAAERSLD